MASALRRRAFVLGGHITNFVGKGSPTFKQGANPPIEWYIAEAVTGALKNTGVEAKSVQTAYIGNFCGELFCNQGHLGAALVGVNNDFRFIPSMRVEGACASGGLAFASGVRDIQAGRDVVMVAGAEVQTTVSARQGAAYLATASHFAKQRSLDEFTFPALFAQRMKAYRNEFNVPEDAMAHTVVKAYENGNLNPLAHMHLKKMTFDDAKAASDTNPNFLRNPELKQWLKVSDCSQVSDGGAALMLVSEDGLAALGKTPADAIEVLTCVHTTDDLYEEGNHFRMDCSRTAAQRAYEQTGLGAGDMQLAEVHDCFSIAEVLMCEALGFADLGAGWSLAANGESTRDGRIPVNVGGGLLSMGHPVGATGVKQILEIYKQMKRQGGAYQVDKDIELGITANMGGSDKTVVLGIFQNRS